jgi:diaminohydroxyphosphoribosylaminopyrimidine deaminase/5-amino-6-(5-phosphoribosylamino)uracil reductase
MSDNLFMKKALQLAARGNGETSPNPMVGAVIVKGGKIIAQGYHKRAGTPHAEIVALKKAGHRAMGATLYVTLEPCCHTGKKTPPCTNSIIESGIKRVVAAMTDPNPKVSGKGLKALRKAGVEVKSGVLNSEAARLNEAFTKYITTRVPFVILKIAQSLDGKIATARGESKWITGDKARERVHKLRHETDALLVGIGTLQKDNPSLDCRVKGGSNPYRIVVDSSLRISPGSKIFKHNDNKTIIATTDRASTSKINRLTKLGARVLIIKSRGGRVNLNHLMKELGKLEIVSLMIEGGSSVSAAALSSKIVDKVMFFVAPKIIGGADSFSSVGGPSPSLLKNAFQLNNLTASQYGKDILLEGYCS